MHINHDINIIRDISVHLARIRKLRHLENQELEIISQPNHIQKHCVLNKSSPRHPEFPIFHKRIQSFYRIKIFRKKLT